MDNIELVIKIAEANSKVAESLIWLTKSDYSKCREYAIDCAEEAKQLLTEVLEEVNDFEEVAE